MKKVKIVFWLLLLALLAVIIHQNWEPLKKPMSFTLSIWKVGAYSTPEAPLVVILSSLFLLGLLVAYFYSLYGYFKQNKTIKHLNATVAAQTEEIEALRRKVKDLDGPAAVPTGETPRPSAVDA